MCRAESELRASARSGVARRGGARGLAAVFLTLGALACSGPSPAPVEPPVARAPGVTWQVDLGRERRAMAGGIGASWHSLAKEHEIDGSELVGGLHPASARGSAWGGNPPIDWSDSWHELRRHASWLAFSWLRVEMSQSMYQPESGRFDWENEEMKALDAILDWCNAASAEVILAQMWSAVEWNRFSGVHALQSGPRSLDAFAEGLASAVEHLVRRRGHRSIRWLTIVNEPNLAGGWWLGPDRQPLPLGPALAAVRSALDRRGLDVELAAPDWNRLHDAAPGQFDWQSDPSVGAFVAHNYSGPRTTPEMKTWVERARQRGIPFFVGELGDFKLGWKGSNAGPRSFDAALSNAQQILAGIELGVDGFNRWSFTNRGDLDGQWQLVRTWDSAARGHLRRIEPEPVPYFTYAVLSRYWANRSTALATLRRGDARVATAALRSPAGELTLLVANSAPEPVKLEVALAGVRLARTLFRYQVSEAQLERAGVRLDPVAVLDLVPGRARLADELPARSLTAYSTYHRLHDDPGVVAEPSPDEVAQKRAQRVETVPLSS